jgi:hypothetical protein
LAAVKLAGDDDLLDLRGAVRDFHRENVPEPLLKGAGKPSAKSRRSRETAAAEALLGRAARTAAAGVPPSP